MRSIDHRRRMAPPYPHSPFAARPKLRDKSMPCYRWRTRSDQRQDSSRLFATRVSLDGQSGTGSTNKPAGLARKRLPDRPEPWASGIRQANHLYLLPNFLRTSPQQEEQKQNRNRNPKKPKQNVSGRSLVLDSLSYFHISALSLRHSYFEYGAPGECVGAVKFLKQAIAFADFQSADYCRP